MNNPSHVLHWSFIDITLANLIVIAIRVAIFGLALVVRFPHRLRDHEAPVAAGEGDAAQSAAPEPGDANIGTGRFRADPPAVLPPKRRLPDHQPAYVASPIST